MSISQAGLGLAGVVSRVLALALEAAGPVAGEDLREGPTLVVIGATGIVGLGGDLGSVAERVRADLPRSEVLIVSDAVTAAVGALDGHPGAMVAAGTGSVGLGTDMATSWRVVDGWGHLLGDLGGGAWIGRQAMRAVVEAVDGRRMDPVRLREALTAELGEVDSWAAQLYTSDERAGILARAARPVAQLALEGDDLSAAICREAGRELARTLCAAAFPGASRRVTWTGGVVSEGGVTAQALRAEVLRRLPGAEVTRAVGDPLDGAFCLAERIGPRALQSLQERRLGAWFPMPTAAPEPRGLDSVSL
ncbi:N-acetylglucosamine kinase-like BadF-type ATPase [Serinibacter salmoneus]|uniref:N-acetylglucosamine kinase-like BadF-type ATPase n=2 Tax=Serinibacter salmoneus TaxID=556530 RepID=A0A2A9D028_9MICO|nr:BadF/BadG/BcrA/BcrD ATPase family protein [Serinibacter salmoneus]PFG20058.1 N-acetylglucosamine kinase-like BadF-type ATPase [Serinibacter salmoneus]